MRSPVFKSAGAAIWHNCYDDGWGTLITTESYAHPAKFARGLIERIIRHGIERGYWVPGQDVLGDPFGGVALGGIVAAYHGLAWIGVELEEKFVALGQANIDLHAAKLKQLGVEPPVIVQGDSRNFAEIVRGAAGICTSPPYAETGRGGPDGRPDRIEGSECAKLTRDNYGSSPGQIGSLPAGSLAGVLTNKNVASDNAPPYNSEHEKITRQQDVGGPVPVGPQPERNRGEVRHLSRRGVASPETGELPIPQAVRVSPDSVQEGPQEACRGGYEQGQGLVELEGRERAADVPGQGDERNLPDLRGEEEPGDSPHEPRSLRQQAGEHASPVCVLPHEPPQDGILEGEAGRQCSAQEQRPGGLDGIISSPPYGSEALGHAGGEGPRTTGAGHSKPGTVNSQEYGQTPGNIGNLKSGDLAGICTSPPYAEGLGHGGGREWKQPNSDRRDNSMEGIKDQYGETPGQIGQDAGDSYWQAMAQVYAQCLQALRPSGVLAVVIKSYVKQGKIVPLPDQTWQLLLHLGFLPLERVRAMLVKEHETPGLFGQVKTKKERKSFFRRLAEKKGSPAIDFEEVLFVQAPALDHAGPLFEKEKSCQLAL